MPSPKSIAEIETTLLDELRAVPGCEEVAWVTIIARGSGDWICGPIRTGKADPALCRNALLKIERRLRSQHTVKV